jgi:hypothetical protein
VTDNEWNVLIHKLAKTVTPSAYTRSKKGRARFETVLKKELKRMEKETKGR